MYTQHFGSMENLDLGVLSGDATLKHELVLNNAELIKIGLVIFVAFFVSTFLANLITK